MSHLDKVLLRNNEWIMGIPGKHDPMGRAEPLQGFVQGPRARVDLFDLPSARSFTTVSKFRALRPCGCETHWWRGLAQDRIHPAASRGDRGAQGDRAGATRLPRALANIFFFLGFFWL